MEGERERETETERKRGCQFSEWTPELEYIMWRRAIGAPRGQSTCIRAYDAHLCAHHISAVCMDAIIPTSSNILDLP